MRYIGKIVLIVSAILVAHSARPAFAQRSEKPGDEQLETPVTTTRTDGGFKNLNSLPESIRRSKIYARMLFEYGLKADENGYYNMESRLAEFKRSEQDLINASMNAEKVAGSQLPVFSAAWTNVGPSSSSISAGCTKALAINPTNGSIIYAGGAAGGVWKTTNGGTSWTPLTDNVIPDLAIASIAIDPSSTNTIYVATGDPSVAIDGLSGSGLYKSTDAGATWKQIATSTFSHTVSKVLVHPTNSNIVFAASEDGSNRGLFRSTNGGTSFTKVYPTSGTSAGVIWDVISAQTISGSLIMYMIEGNQPGGSSSECGVYKSVDDGQTWSKITTAGLPAGGSIGKGALAVPANNKSQVFVWMANPNGDLSGAGLWQSTNSGGQFTKITTVPTTVFNVGAGAQGWYDLYLAVAPNTSPNDTIYIGGVEAYVSYDGGQSWNSYSDYNGSTNVHVDNQSIAIDPSNSRHVWIGTDGGVYRSTNSGSSWSYFSSGMVTTRTYHIGLDANDYQKTYAGFQDEGLWRTTNGGNPQAVWGGDGFQPIVDPTNSNTFYVEGPQGDLVKLTNGGSSSQNITGSNFEQSSAWDTPFKMAPGNHLILYTGRTKLWKSVDGGASWNTASPSIGNPYINSIGLSPSDPNTIWLGLESGKIKLSQDGGSTWNDKSTGIPNASVLSFACHPDDASWALVSVASTSTGSARVLLTTNAGSSWTNVSGSGSTALPGVPVHAVALDSTNPSSVWYAATENGIYYTLNAGQKWSIAGSGIGLAACFDVQVHANGKTIRVGTHGRGIWEANTNILPVELSSLIATKTSKGTDLAWHTDSEINDAGFWIERSYNYAPFVDVAFVPGAGNSNTVRSYDFLDTMTSSGVYLYQLKQVDLDGSPHYSNSVEVSYGSAARLQLEQSFPNPFIVGGSGTGIVRLKYQLPAEDKISLSIYSASGVLIRTLVDNVTMQGGEQEADWDGTNASGALVPSGVYFYTLETSDGSRITNKMVLLEQ